MTILYPVAANAQAALSAPVGWAPREAEAQRIAGGAVRFISEAAGPAFADRDAALDAYAGKLDDDRAGKSVRVAPENRYVSLRALAAPPGGERKTVWRASVAYWKIVELATPVTATSAKKARRSKKSANLSKEDVHALTAAPMRSDTVQKALDFGLFDAPLWEEPGRMIPDE